MALIVIKSQLAVLMIMPQFTVISALQIINNAGVYYYHQRLDALPRRTSPRTPNAHTCRGHSLHLSGCGRPAGGRIARPPSHVSSMHTRPHQRSSHWHYGLGLMKMVCLYRFKFRQYREKVHKRGNYYWERGNTGRVAACWKGENFSTGAC